MTREEAIEAIKEVYGNTEYTDRIIQALEQEPFDIETYCKEHFVVMVDKDVWEKAEKALEQKPKTIQEIQAESEKYQKAFEDGYDHGYAQARFDYEQEPCEDAISRKEVLNQIFYSTDNSGDVVLGSVLRHRIESLPPVTPQQSCEDVAKAFQIGMALGFGEKHDEMDKVIDEIKKAVKPQEKTKRCKECKYSEYCRRWGNKYKTEEDDYCFMFEPQESEG